MLFYLLQSVHSNSFGNICAIYHLLVDKLEKQDLKVTKPSSGSIPLVATQRKASITTGMLLLFKSKEIPHNVRLWALLKIK